MVDDCDYRVKRESYCGEIKQYPEAAAMFEPLFSQIDVGNGDSQSDAISEEMIDNMIKDMPLRTLVTFTDVPQITRAKITAMLDELNKQLSDNI